jgi:hypothetical protein
MRENATNAIPVDHFCHVLRLPHGTSQVSYVMSFR